MAHKFAEIAFTNSVRDVQEKMGSRAGYASMDQGEGYNFLLGERERAFIHARDSFYMASVSETGWPYLQHRGGPVGFMKVLGASTIGFADYSGNSQYITTGNVLSNNRVALFFMDYPNRARLKLLGRMEIVDPDEMDRLALLEDNHYRARIERGMLIHVEAFDWNCPQHITPRYSQSELDTLVEPILQENRRLKASRAQAEPSTKLDVGSGELELVITGVRQLAEKVRAFELRRPSGGDLPEFEPGAHLEVPVPMPDGTIVTRRYSIASNPNRRDVFEIAVLLESDGSGGSRSIHDNYHLGTVLKVSKPISHFALHGDNRASILIAGGIGITPIKPMAQALAFRGADFQLHYAGRDSVRMAYLDRLQREFGNRFTSYISDQGQRMDLDAILENAPADAVIYVCGPSRLIDGVVKTAAHLGIDAGRVRFERFKPGIEADAKPVEVKFARSGIVIQVTPEQTILDAALEAGVAVPHSCKLGHCRSCAVRVLDGEPDHKDSSLTVKEREDLGLMCPCVSRAKSDVLVLDL
tara:strand:- start:2286 stop:3866 length:1581 start_codon:yes stop_codon:yes gene_type:complete